MYVWFLQSHWDELPPEIQDYVLSLATWQHILDRRNNELLRSLHKEILDFAKLKEEWGTGHIKNVVCRCGFPCCRGKKDKFEYLKIYGCYIDIDDKPRKTYSSDTYETAMERAPIEKTFIYPIGLRSVKYNLYRYNKSLTESLG